MTENTRPESSSETLHEHVVERWRDLLKQDLEPHVRKALERLIREEEQESESAPPSDATDTAPSTLRK